MLWLLIVFGVAMLALWVAPTDKSQPCPFICPLEDE